ncbi:hypothetical protein QUF90_10600 [Desulfococcaceae bacterium HSG9]|nr:hypothetical protein [Desulfococcaceae bacterium HSG9]
MINNRLKKFINDHGKWIIATSVSFAGFLATIIIFLYYYESQYDALGYQVVSVVNIGETGAESFDDLKFKYNKFIIDSGSIVRIIIENKRKNPIRSNDFESPISIIFNNIKILDSSIKNAVPSNMKLKLTNYENKITIEPTLLNRNDNFTIDVLTDGIFSSLKVNGRIAGIKSIKEFKKDQKNLKIMVGCCCILLAFAWMTVWGSLNSSFRYKQHVAIYMLSYTFFFFQFLATLTASLFSIIGLIFFGVSPTWVNVILLASSLLIVEIFVEKLLRQNVLITFSKRKDETDGKHKFFFQIALNSSITIIPPAMQEVGDSLNAKTNSKSRDR